MGCREGSELLCEKSVNGKIEGRGLDIQLKFDRVSLIPVIGEAMRVPILAEFLVRAAT
jgi:hypothetical protein